MLLEFITQNWLGLLLVIGFLVYFVYISITKQWTKVRELAYQMMLLAERTFSNEDGKIKFDFVVRVVYKNLPPWLKLFVKEEDLRNLIQAWYEIAKDFLDDGQVNESVK